MISHNLGKSISWKRSSAVVERNDAPIADLIFFCLPPLGVLDFPSFEVFNFPSFEVLDFPSVEVLEVRLAVSPRDFPLTGVNTLGFVACIRRNIDMSQRKNI